MSKGAEPMTDPKYKGGSTKVVVDNGRGHTITLMLSRRQAKAFKHNTQYLSTDAKWVAAQYMADMLGMKDYVKAG